MKPTIRKAMTTMHTITDTHPRRTKPVRVAVNFLPQTGWDVVVGRSTGADVTHESSRDIAPVTRYKHARRRQPTRHETVPMELVLAAAEQQRAQRRVNFLRAHPKPPTNL